MTENRTYTEADLNALRKDWEQERTQTDLIKQIAEIKGQLLVLPVTMEAIARKVVSDVLDAQYKQNADNRAQRTERTWKRAPVIIEFAQLLALVVLPILAYLAGKGHIP